MMSNIIRTIELCNNSKITITFKSRLSSTLSIRPPLPFDRNSRSAVIVLNYELFVVLSIEIPIRNEIQEEKKIPLILHRCCQCCSLVSYHKIADQIARCDDRPLIPMIWLLSHSVMLANVFLVRL